ncbi:MAG TPA: VOC family protein [Candidatus Cybelea sp.]|jgi:predicted 3-demethylubiquinone-9 3-methyltransferase (glyoxalase superfamily)
MSANSITPLLWFNGEAEEAVRFYVSIFSNSKIENISRYGDAGPGEEGAAMMIEFQLEGKDYMALNGSSSDAEQVSGSDVPQGAIALFVNCPTQAEVDRLWQRLGEGGEYLPCGWLHDRYGFAWNIVPEGLGELLGNPDREKAERAMRAMLEMGKLDINELRRAFDGG